MSENTESLEREVEARRSSVENTIEELRSRMSVGQIVDEVTDYFGKGQTQAAAQNLGRQVRDNPLALGLVGAGLAWLFLGRGVQSGYGSDRDTRYGTRRDDLYNDVYAGDDPYGADDDPVIAAYPRTGDLSSRYDDAGRYDSAGRYEGTGSGEGLASRAGSAASDAAGKVGDTLSDVASRVADGASAAASRLSGAADRAGSAASGAGEAARGYGRSAADAARGAQDAGLRGARSAGQGAYRLGRRAQRGFLETLQEEPLVFGAIAVAVGAAIGASFPSTRTEDEYLGDARDRLRDQAYDYGKGAVESAKDVAAETYKAASEEADRQGLKPTGENSTLAEKVSSVVGTAADTAKEQARKDDRI